MNKRFLPLLLFVLLVALLGIGLTLKPSEIPSPLIDKPAPVFSLPLLQQHLGHLHGHHRLEDTHYFPQFRVMEPRIGSGIDLLENDHESLHRAIDVLEELTRRLASLGLDDPETSALIQKLAGALHRFGPEMSRLYQLKGAITRQLNRITKEAKQNV